MFCSTIIPTVGRATLARAVRSVLDQGFSRDDFEVIVVNDSGRPLPDAEWQKSDQVQVIHMNRRERSVARNAGAAIAQGQYLHFLDDDDWLFPDAFHHLRALAETSDAAWLYGSTQLVDRQGKPIIQLHHGLTGNCFAHVMAGEWMPLQSSLIDARTFFAAGGFNPLIPGAEDIDFLRRMALLGDIAETQRLVAYIAKGEAGSTTDYGRHAEMRRWARELTLNSPGAFRRFRTSASSSYLHARVLRVYLTSVVWNLRHKRLLPAASRATFALTIFALAGRPVLSASFWLAVVEAYENKTFIRGFQEANCPLDGSERSETSIPRSVSED
jgi:glycosyltransferase involved in cell wall biosynthesis